VDDKLEHWKKLLVPINGVSTDPPGWLIKNMLVPGMTVIAGPPKVFKSFLVLNIAAAICHGRAVGDAKDGRLAVKRGTVVYMGKEQSAGRVRHMYEQRILKKRLPDKPLSWSFVMVRDAWQWRIDEPAAGYEIEQLVRDMKPTVCVLDPLVYFHQMDENDPRLVHPLVPIRQAVLSYGGSLIVVHHNRKRAGDPRASAKTGDWDQIRGTSALWGMADSGIMLSKLPSGAINVAAEYKDYPSRTWVWRPK
jgi:RecA-family ATPase